MFRPGSSYSYHQVLRRFVVPASRAHVYSAAMAAAATIGPWLTGRIDLACLVGEPDEPSKPRLLEQVRDALRVRHYSRRTERAYLGWIRRFVLFPTTMIYTHVLNRGPGAVRSPIDRLLDRTGMHRDIVAGAPRPPLQVPCYTANSRRLSHQGKSRPGGSGD